MSGGGIIARQNSYLRSFKNAGATSPKTAKTLKKLHIVPVAVFDRMEKAGVFVKIEEDKYYMDEQKVGEFIAKRTRYARILLVAVVSVAVIVYIANSM
jgi:hypothetical protein